MPTSSWACPTGRAAAGGHAHEDVGMAPTVIPHDLAYQTSTQAGSAARHAQPSRLTPMSPATPPARLYSSIAAVALMLGVMPSIAPAAEVALNGHQFRVPDGFTVELVAGPPLVDRPIVADYDERGRLYVAESSGTNDKAAVQLETKPHRILRLEDVDGDGRFDRRTVFADRMMFPEGAMWLDGSLYVAAPPSIWKLTDTDGDGLADRRGERFQGKTLTGCAHGLHGADLGPY